MSRESKYDEGKLRGMIEAGNTVAEIMEAFGIKRPAYDTYVLKLMKTDGKFYDVPDPTTRNTTPKISKSGLHISIVKMNEYGFNVGDILAITKELDGKVVIEKK